MQGPACFSSPIFSKGLFIHRKHTVYLGIPYPPNYTISYPKMSVFALVFNSLAVSQGAGPDLLLGGGPQESAFCRQLTRSADTGVSGENTEIR